MSDAMFVVLAILVFVAVTIAKGCASCPRARSGSWSGWASITGR
jgi:hypothetical protein